MPRPPTRDDIKAAFRTTINKSKSRGEARRISKLRAKYLAGTLTADEAIIGWLDLTLDVKPTGIKGQQGLKVVA